MNYALSMELIIFPITLIGQVAACISQYSKTIHLIVLPFPIIYTFLSVIKLSNPISLPILFVAFVSRPRHILLNYVLLAWLGSIGVLKRHLLYYRVVKYFIVMSFIDTIVCLLYDGLDLWCDSCRLDVWGNACRLNVRCELLDVVIGFGDIVEYNRTV